MTKAPVECPGGIRTVLKRNIAARGLLRNFHLTASRPGGSVEITSGPLPFFIFAKTRTVPLESDMTIRRGFFDASFEIAVLPDTTTNVTLR